MKGPEFANNIISCMPSHPPCCAQALCLAPLPALGALSRQPPSPSSSLGLSAGLPLQPQRGSPPAVVEGGVGCIVFHIRLPGAGDHAGDGVHIILLRGHIALNVENELL